MNKKGYFFTVDAFVALLLILGVVLFIKPTQNNISFESNIDGDMIKVLSTLKIGEIDNFYVQQLKDDGNITNMNLSILEQIGEFYAKSSPLAESLAQSVLNQINLSENSALYFGNKEISRTGSIDYSNSTRIYTSRQILSGISNTSGAATGYSAIASLRAENFVFYTYFGGYVGDGEISARILFRPTNLNLEAAFSDNFSIYLKSGVNPEVWLANYTNVQKGIPYKLDLNAYLNQFHSGLANDLIFRSLKDNGSLYISGGYIKASYNITLPSFSTYLPGVKGLINIYDGFYVPNALEELNVTLHYNSSYDLFMTIGNTEVYRGNSSGAEIWVTLDNTTLAGKLSNFANFTNKTIPFRIGLANVSYTKNQTIYVDALSVSDISGSMEGSTAGNCLDECNEFTCPAVGQPGYCGTTCPICQSKQANGELINSILNISKNSLGLVGYNFQVYNYDVHHLSKEANSLSNLMYSKWDADGGTCICCGVNRGITEMINSSVLLAHYSLEGNTLDRGVYGMNGVITTTGTGNVPYVAGVNGTGLWFNGSIANKEYLNAGGLSDVNSRGTIAFWFKLNNSFNGASATQGLWSKYYSDSQNSYIALKGTGLSGGGSAGSLQVKFEGGYSGGAIVYLNSVTTSWQANVWYHVAVTWDGVNLKLYINGIEVDSENNLYRSIDFPSGNHNFGRSFIDSGNYPSQEAYFNGTMDDIKVYKKRLNSTEIQGLANAIATCGNEMTETGETCDGEEVNCPLVGSIGVRKCNSQCTGFNSCEQTSKYRTMIVMSDGVPNYECSPYQYVGDNDPRAVNDAINSACNARDNYGIHFYAVGFGSSAGNATLQGIGTTCGDGYFYGDVNNIIDIYKNISNQIIEASYSEQTIEGEGFSTMLLPDSKINIKTKSQLPAGFVIAAETPRFGNNLSQGSFTIPNNTQIYDAKIVSYSGSKWTSLAEVFNVSGSGMWEKIFDLSYFGSNYTELGDPYFVGIPLNKLQYGNNTVRLNVSLGPSPTQGGSPDNKVLYTLIKNASSYSPIVSSANGCEWNVEFVDGSFSNLTVPSSYSGSDKCSYTSSDVIYNQNDAIDYAVYYLFRELDLDSDGKVDSKLTDQDLSITNSTVSGIPFTWETEVQCRVWY